MADEIKFKLAKTPNIDTGRVSFEGDEKDIARANILLRTAQRVHIVLGRFPATTFTELFDGVRALPLEDYIPANGAFPVKGWSLNSQLASVPDCQSIIKKAAVERLKTKYKTEWFPEDGQIFQLQFSILRDQAVILLDTSGDPLHKRGYRPVSNEAPLRETLSAAIADIARVRDYHRVVDPFCGSGTLLIEAAMKALNIAPGLRRHFSAEQWACLPNSIWRETRLQAESEQKTGEEFSAEGYDIDPKAVALTLDNARRAGLEKFVKASVRDIADFTLPDDEKKNLILTNPPYGERMLDVDAAAQIYKTMGGVFEKRKGVGYYIISSHDRFEYEFGRKADSTKPLFNGKIKCKLFMYFRW